MTNPIGTAQERELIEDLRKAAAHVRFSQTGTEASLSKVLTPAADALQSRIAEVGRLTKMSDECAEDLRREFDYVPDESGGEKWTVYQDRALLVIHPDRLVRVYRRGSDSYHEIDPMPW